MSHLEWKYRDNVAHRWIAKLLYEIFAVGVYWANEVGEFKAILVTQRRSYESQELSVSYRHRGHEIK